MDSKQSYSAIAKQLFSNPIKKIKLTPFLQAQFSQRTLDTVIRKFTDRNKKKISIKIIYKQLLQDSDNSANERFYLDFLLTNFKQKQQGYIEVEDFIQIFLTDTESNLMLINNKQSSKLYNSFCGSQTTISPQSLVNYAKQIGYKMDINEAKEIIKFAGRNGKTMDKYDFLNVVKAPSSQ